MRKLSYSNAEVDFLKHSKSACLEWSEATTTQDPNSWEMGNAKLHVICRRRACSQTVSEGEKNHEKDDHVYF